LFVSGLSSKSRICESEWKGEGGSWFSASQIRSGALEIDEPGARETERMAEADITVVLLIIT
jgi:hypothetical protein